MEALLATNDQLHHSAVDDAMSGTTAVSALVRGRALYVANVGDSRAVLAERAPGGRLTAVPLSYDHTPFRRAPVLSRMPARRCLHSFVGHLGAPAAVHSKPVLPEQGPPAVDTSACMPAMKVVKPLCRQDECIRVKKYGTRILTLDQIEGIKVRLGHSHTGNALMEAWLFTACS